MITDPDKRPTCYFYSLLFYSWCQAQGEQVEKQTASLSPWSRIQNVQPFLSSLGPQCTSKRTQIVLRWFCAEEMPLNWVCSPEQKACSSEVLVVSFLNQGHLFLSGKREMFLKARLSIKIYWLPWRPLYHTGLRSVFNCVIFFPSIQRFSIVKKQITFSVVYLKVHYWQGNK